MECSLRRQISFVDLASVQLENSKHQLSQEICTRWVKKLESKMKENLKIHERKFENIMKENIKRYEKTLNDM